jgi:hypothetical protein
MGVVILCVPESRLKFDPGVFKTLLNYILAESHYRVFNDDYVIHLKGDSLYIDMAMKNIQYFLDSDINEFINHDSRRVEPEWE